jgi:hypothetical protein
VAERDTPLGRWAKELMSRAHRNVAVVAFANKLARIAWAVLRRRKPFDAKAVAVAAWRFARSERKRRSCKRGLREGEDEMASHGEALVNLGARAGIPVGFRDPRSAVWPESTRRDMNPLVFEHVQPRIRSPLGRLHHDPACGGQELRKMKPF